MTPKQQEQVVEHPVMLKFWSGGIVGFQSLVDKCSALHIHTETGRWGDIRELLEEMVQGASGKTVPPEKQKPDNEDTTQEGEK